MASSGDMLAGWFSRLTRARALIIAALVSLSLLVIWQLRYTGVVPSFSAKSPPGHLSPGGCAGAIPNIVHYVYVLKDGSTGSYSLLYIFGHDQISVHKKKMDQTNLDHQ